MSKEEMDALMADCRRLVESMGGTCEERKPIAASESTDDTTDEDEDEWERLSKLRGVDYIDSRAYGMDDYTMVLNGDSELTYLWDLRKGYVRAMTDSTCCYDEDEAADVWAFNRFVDETERRYYRECEESEERDYTQTWSYRVNAMRD